ncbi:MAG: hypothetical protein WCO77_13265 [bacterium]
MSIESISFPGVFFPLLGFAMIMFQKLLARQAVYWNMRLWKFAGTEKGYQFAFALGGVAFLIFGIMSLLDIVQFRD